MNNTCLIKIKVDYLELTKYLIRNEIYFDNLKNKNGYLTLRINNNDLCVLEKKYNVEVLKQYGLKGLINFIKKHYIIILSLLLSYILLLVLSNVIFDIEIVTNNMDLKNRINLYLKENGIEKYKFMKSYKKLNEIKNIILEENKTTLEWIEIEKIGTKYKIDLTERVITNNIEDETPKDLVASKDALIKYMVVKKGTPIKEVNELVKKGEVIISGLVTNNDKVVSEVKASGEVYGEVWYTVTTTVPFNHIDYEKTGKIVNHIYMNIFGKKLTLFGHYETSTSMNTEEVIINKPYLFFTIVNEKKELYTYKKHTLTKEEAQNEAIKRSDESIKRKLKSNEYIIDKKVLKNKVYSSKIELEIFYRVYESIGTLKEIEKKEEEGE